MRVQNTTLCNGSMCIRSNIKVCNRNSLNNLSPAVSTTTALTNTYTSYENIHC